jgi:hypothetical protein
VTEASAKRRDAEYHDRPHAANDAGPKENGLLVRGPTLVSGPGGRQWLIHGVRAGEVGRKVPGAKRAEMTIKTKIEHRIVSESDVVHYKIDVRSSGRSSGREKRARPWSEVEERSQVR